MTMKWTECATVKLMVLYGRYECLRNPFHPDFSKQLCRYKAYKQIVDSMNVFGLTVCDCVKRISFMKRQYCHELSKISTAISCGKYYKPKSCWFEMMHELLFPYIQSCGYSGEFQKDLTNSEGEGEVDGDRFDNESEMLADYECTPCACLPCEELDIDSENVYDRSRSRHHYLKPWKTKLHAQSKMPGVLPVQDKDCQTNMRHVKMSGKRGKYRKASMQTDSVAVSSKSSTKWTQIRMNSTGIDNRLNTVSISQMDSQTEKKTTRNAGTVHDDENEQLHQNNEAPFADNVYTDTDETARKKHQDEFDMFGKSIAYQLRSLDLESAVNLEKKIQDMTTEERLGNMKDGTEAEGSKQECSCSCSDCRECCKESICSCGLPVSKCLPPIAIKTSRCCGFCCE